MQNKAANCQAMITRFVFWAKTKVQSLSFFKSQWRYCRCYCLGSTITLAQTHTGYSSKDCYSRQSHAATRKNLTLVENQQRKRFLPALVLHSIRLFFIHSFI